MAACWRRQAKKAAKKDKPKDEGAGAGGADGGEDVCKLDIRVGVIVKVRAVAAAPLGAA